MNGAHIHLLLNHIPILGSLFVLCLLVYGVLTNSQSVIKASLLGMVVVALISIPVFLSGEEAEHVVEPIIGINETALESHEEMGEIAFWIMLMAGAIALGTIFAGRSAKSTSMPLVWINLVMMLIVFVMMARTGWSGGEIRHSEINMVVTGDSESEEDHKD